MFKIQSMLEIVIKQTYSYHRDHFYLPHPLFTLSRLFIYQIHARYSVNISIPVILSPSDNNQTLPELSSIQIAATP